MPASLDSPGVTGEWRDASTDALPGERGSGRLFVISTGPAGPRTSTLQALEALERVQVLAAPEQQVQLFGDYIAGKPVLFDPWKGLFDFKGKRVWDLGEAERERFQEERFRLRDERVGLIREVLAAGQDFGLLETGNPCLFGPGHWYKEPFDPDEVVIIPGMGCDAAAMAALGQSTIPAHDVRYLVQTSPYSLTVDGRLDRAALEDIARHACTLVLYMALRDTGHVFEALREVLPGDTPCAVVYWAGYPGRQRVLRGRLDCMSADLSEEEEDFMGLLFVGRFLEGKPYEASLNRLGRTRGKVAGAGPADE